MRTWLFCTLLVLLLALGAAVPLATPVAAANLTCSAAPASGPVGTTFTLRASGFTPNTPVWLYAVEPDGTAFSDPTFNGFGGGAKADSSGAVAFSFPTRFAVLGFPIDRALGSWTLVVQELGPGAVTVNQANCQVTLTSGGEQVLAGASLSVSPAVATVGSDLIVRGSGFGPNEVVNLWVSPPAGCSSWAYELPHLPPLQYAGASAYAQDSVRTDSGGSFGYVLPTFTEFTCLGDWAISAWAPGSGVGALARYHINGQTVGGGASMSVNPTSAFSRGGVLTFRGSGYQPNGTASCWETRPEGTVRFIGTFQVDSGGSLAFTHVTGMDDDRLEMHYSEGSLGLYAMTCRDNVTGATGETSYQLVGQVTDP